MRRKIKGYDIACMLSFMFFFSSSNCRFSSGNKETRKVFYEKGIYLRYDVHHASFHQNVRPEIDPVLHRYLQVILLIRSHSIKKYMYFYYVLLVRFVCILNVPSHYTTNIQDIGYSALLCYPIYQTPLAMTIPASL
jgi:hypothetical protein